MKKVLLTFSALLLFVCVGMAQQKSVVPTKKVQAAIQHAITAAKKQQQPVATYKVEPKSSTSTQSRVNTEAYFEAKRAFKAQKPNATREEINQFLDDWK